MLPFIEYPEDELTYLSRRDVVAACESVDVYAVVEDTLRRHGNGDTLLPNEAYMGWRTKDGHAARSLAMPGAVRKGDDLCLGVKVINGSLGNPANGLARSQGLLLMFEPETAWPRVLMESAYISAMRTAAVTAVSARYLGRGPLRRIALLGCGTLARAHVTMLCRTNTAVESICLFDTVPQRASALAKAIEQTVEAASLSVRTAEDPATCVRDADLVVTVTTADRGYLRHEWFAPGALISHVSLDDVLPDVVRRAGLIVVDDWNLVSQDRNRLLGRMYGGGELRGPDGSYHPGAPADPSAPKVDAGLGEVVSGRHPGRTRDESVILCNPFGMAILDVALGDTIADAAAADGLGRKVRR